MINKIIRKFNDNRFYFHKITPLKEDVEIEIYGEPSFKKEETNQQGLVVIIRLSATQKASLISRKSNTADRTAWSTVAAETFALQQVLDKTVYTKNMLKGFNKRIVRATAFTDNLSLRRVLYSRKATKELRLRREIAAARDLLTHDQIKVRHVPTDSMLADPMTESMAADNLLRVGRMNNLYRVDNLDKENVSAADMLEAELDIPMLELSKRLESIQQQYNHQMLRNLTTRRVRRVNRSNSTATGTSNRES